MPKSLISRTEYEPSQGEHEKCHFLAKIPKPRDCFTMTSEAKIPFLKKKNKTFYFPVPLGKNEKCFPKRVRKHDLGLGNYLKSVTMRLFEQFHNTLQ